MFDFVGKFLGARPKKKQAAARARTASQRARTTRVAPTRKARGISYDSSLIENLEKDHEMLVDLFGKMWSEGFEKSDFQTLATYVADFKAMFQTHLLKENVKFYAYLEQSMKDDVHTLGVVREFRRDMNDIANAVIGFCKKYEHAESIRVAKESFTKDYQDIGQALVRRVQLEERDLYSLYSHA